MITESGRGPCAAATLKGAYRAGPSAVGLWLTVWLWERERHYSKSNYLIIDLLKFYSIECELISRISEFSRGVNSDYRHKANFTNFLQTNKDDQDEFTKTCWLSEFGAVQRDDNLVDLESMLQTEYLLATIGYDIAKSYNAVLASPHRERALALSPCTDTSGYSLRVFQRVLRAFTRSGSMASMWRVLHGSQIFEFCWR